MALLGGQVERQKLRVADVTRPGVDGHAELIAGYKAPMSQLVTEKDFDSAVLMETAMEAYAALQGTAVSITDEAGVVYSSCTVFEVRTVGKFQVGAAVGGYGSIASGRWVLRTRWAVRSNV